MAKERGGGEAGHNEVMERSKPYGGISAPRPTSFAPQGVKGGISDCWSQILPSRIAVLCLHGEGLPVWVDGRQTDRAGCTETAQVFTAPLVQAAPSPVWISREKRSEPEHCACAVVEAKCLNQR